MLPSHASNFQAVAQAHLRSLEESGQTPEQIQSQLEAVAHSYASDGLVEEASALREVLRRYRLEISAGAVDRPWQDSRLPALPADVDVHATSADSR